VTQSDQERPGCSAADLLARDEAPTQIHLQYRVLPAGSSRSESVRVGYATASDNWGTTSARTKLALSMRRSPARASASIRRTVVGGVDPFGLVLEPVAARPRGWWLAREGPGARLTTCGEPYGPQGASRRTLAGSCSLNRERPARPAGRAGAALLRTVVRSSARWLSRAARRRRGQAAGGVRKDRDPGVAAGSAAASRVRR
jgi:hypothetical protein